MNDTSKRREFLKLGMAGLATAGVVGAAATIDVQKAAAQAAPDSLLRTVLERGKVIVGTGSTNAPWHFENDAGELVGMDITMGRILAKGLFDDTTKVEFVMQDPAQRIPNVTTNKVDISIQFMTMTAQRSQLIHFSRPYYVEGIALLTLPNAENKTFDQLLARGSATRISILQNVDAE
ncbi:MAG: transporter substrate-binding domain-containing protein, partial [Mesorhizobium sp.]